MGAPPPSKDLQRLARAYGLPTAGQSKAKLALSLANRTGGRPVNVAAFGDSLMDQYSNAPTNWGVGSWVNAAAALSGGAFRLVYNGGVQGQTSAQVLARVATALDALIAAGTRVDAALFCEQINDFAANVPWATTLANHQSFAALCWARGIEPIWVTTTPTTNASFAAVSQNALLTTAGLAAGVRVLDTASVLTGSNGLLLSAYSLDGTHPNTAGHLLSASSVLQAFGAPQRGDLYGPGNLVNNGLFTGPAGGTAGMSADWFDAFGSAPATFALNAAPAGRPGFRQRITRTDSSSNVKDLARTPIATGLTPGKRYAVSFEFAASTTGAMTYKAAFTWRNGASDLSVFIPILDWNFSVTDGVIWYEVVAPVTANTLRVEMVVGGNGTGWYEFGALGVRQLN